MLVECGMWVRNVPRGDFYRNQNLLFKFTHLVASTICSHVRHLNNHNSNLMSMQQSPSISHKTQHIIRCHQKSNDIKAETSDNQNQKHTRTTQRFFIWTETGISIKLNGFIRTKTCQTKCKQYLDMTNKRDEKKTNQLFDFGFFSHCRVW